MADEGAVATPILCSGLAVPRRGEERHYFYTAKPLGVRASQNQPGCLADPIYFMIKSRGLTHLLAETDVVV